MTTKGKSKWYNFEGEFRYAKVRADKPDEFMGRVFWSVDFFPKDDATAKAIKASGIQMKFKVDKETGKEYMRFRRDTERVFKNDGVSTVVRFAPPVIYGKDGKPLISYVDEKTGAEVRSYNPAETSIKIVGEPFVIGNGSKGVINVCVFPTMKGPGNRFESLRVTDLVEYIRPEASEDIESDSAEDEVSVDW